MGCHTPVGALAVFRGGGIFFSAFVGLGEKEILKKTIQSSNGNILTAVHELAIKFRITINKKIKTGSSHFCVPCYKDIKDKKIEKQKTK